MSKNKNEVKNGHNGKVSLDGRRTVTYADGRTIDISFVKNLPLVATMRTSEGKLDCKVLFGKNGENGEIKLLKGNGERFSYKNGVQIDEKGWAVQNPEAVNAEKVEIVMKVIEDLRVNSR